MMEKNWLGKKKTVLLAATVILLALGSVAWACTTTSEIQVSPQSGPAGSAVRITGAVSQNYPVEIRWNSVSGDKLNSAPIEGPSFSVTVNVPGGMPPDGYVLVAVQNGQVTARASFEVVEESYRTEFNGSGQSLGEAPEESAATTNGMTRKRTTRTASADGVGGGTYPEERIGSQADQVFEPGNLGGSVAAGSQAEAVAAGAGSSAFAGTTARASGLQPGASAEGSMPERAPGFSEMSPRAANSDLWSGFDRSSTSSQLSGLVGKPAEGRSQGGLALGAALLTSAIMALSGGFVIAELGRRRKLQTSGATARPRD